ncbi:YbaB/EbfC family nucleoid-associated protein [Mycolicibacterium goodii]|uniref:YbaB/EbfC family nucleoid-associated protein n=1 Tax=Mycolicibacterium goodii TaxID=134601 RepID=UPI00143D11AD|nr:YbaB/EbfC family nucleoid-associated protein [Mycolicibacterium goodii]MBU8817565.1 YbaB/EbfC family nucleoid-associated protein [Mycolicibacterium goodii]
MDKNGAAVSGGGQVTPKSEIDKILEENLSPKAMQVYREARQRQAVGAKLSEDIAAVKAEAYSPNDDVWACADGQGFITALMIDDDAIVNNSLEELEDLISDTMVEASGRGQAAGEALTNKLDAELKTIVGPIN